MVRTFHERPDRLVISDCAGDGESRGVGGQSADAVADDAAEPVTTRHPVRHHALDVDHVATAR